MKDVLSDAAYALTAFLIVYGGNMSLADDLFIKMCRDILDNGYSTEGEK